MTDVRVKRIYEPPEDDDGARVLVDRIWPRGVSREQAALTAWMPEVAPSTELRKWFGHTTARWEEFRRRYRTELRTHPALAQLGELAAAGPVALLYSARDEARNQPVVLAEVLAEGPG